MNVKRIFLFLPVLTLFLFSCRNDIEISKSEDGQSFPPYFRVSFDPDKPGCGDCHNNEDERQYTLAAKANEKWEDHNFDIEGKLMTINDCLLCHSVVSKGQEGSIAPTPLRTIVHRGHMSSHLFETIDDEGNQTKGNCFTCHYIMGDSSPDLYHK